MLLAGVCLASQVPMLIQDFGGHFGLLDYHKQLI